MNVTLLCKYHGIERQTYYQSRKRSSAEAFSEDVVIQLVLRLRKRLPRLGVRKLYHELRPQLQSLPVKIGRDKLFEILRRHGLLIKRRKGYCVATTDSNHPYRKYENLIMGYEVKGKNEVLVSDITYIATEEGFVYLYLVSDKFSRCILGYEISSSLEAKGALRALEQAFKKMKTTIGVIHHSDRGTQYCSHDYTEALVNRGMKISMSRPGNPYDNAVAERIFGILKSEFLFHKKLMSKEATKTLIKNAIKIYNEERPHLSLNYAKPSEVYAL